MDLNLKGKTALITGASRGIGFGAARVLASEGVNVHLTSRTAADLESARKKLGTVDEIANMVAFLCSDCSGYTTGCVITIDGGSSHQR